MSLCPLKSEGAIYHDGIGFICLNCKILQPKVSKSCRPVQIYTIYFAVYQYNYALSKG